MPSQRQSKALRRCQTEAERRLWTLLRNRKVEGAKFRRQQPMGRYVVDFYCPDARLVIELDGGGHAMSETEDAERTSYLERSGNHVVRYWNTDVLSNPEGVLEHIRGTLRRLTSDSNGEGRGREA